MKPKNRKLKTPRKTKTAHAVATHVRRAERTTRPLPAIETLRKYVFADFESSPFFYVSRASKMHLGPLSNHKVRAVSTLEEARVRAEKIAVSDWPIHKWHYIINVWDPYGPEEMHSTVAEHRAGFGWTTGLGVSRWDDLINWEYLDASISAEEINELLEAQLKIHAVRCPGCRRLIRPPFERYE